MLKIHINKDAFLKVSHNGLEILSYPASKSSYVQIMIPSDLFEVFNVSDEHFNMQDCFFGKVDCGVLCEVMRSPDIECPFSMFFTEEEVKLDIRTENDETEIKQIMVMPFLQGNQMLDLTKSKGDIILEFTITDVT